MSQAVTVVGVRRIELEAPVPVYDATSPRHHNFALANGVIVHNTAKQASDVQFQQILPLRGKIPNILKGKPDEIMLNAEVQAIFRSIGYDPKNKAGPLARRRVSKIVLLVDADKDGKHIANLLLVLLWVVTPQLIRDGMVYTLSDSLFMAKRGSKTVYAPTRNAALELAGSQNAIVTRVKGWGEINASDMKPLAFRKDTRQLIQMTAEGADRLLEVMGADVSIRKRLLKVPVGV